MQMYLKIDRILFVLLQFSLSLNLYFCQYCDRWWWKTKNLASSLIKVATPQKIVQDRYLRVVGPLN